MPSPKSRILHFIDSGGVYGAERVILNLSRELISRGEFEPLVGCIVDAESQPNDLYNVALDVGIRALKIRVRNHLLIPDLPRVAWELKANGISLIHSHGYKPSVFASLIQALVGIPAIATCHLWFRPEAAPFKTRIMICLERWLYRRYPVVVAVSDPIRKILVESGVPRDHTRLIENGIDTSFAILSPAERIRLRAEIGVPESSFCILNTARLTAQKAQWTLIEAAAELRRRQAPVSILIVGQGELEGALRTMIVERDLEETVKLLGFRTDIKALLSIADAFALPSLDEGMPISLLEAVAANLPAIVTPVGDIPKLIKHGQSGTVVAPGDSMALANAIEFVREHFDEARQMAFHAADILARSYSVQAMAVAYSEVYRNVRGRRRP